MGVVVQQYPEGYILPTSDLQKLASFGLCWLGIFADFLSWRVVALLIHQPFYDGLRLGYIFPTPGSMAAHILLNES